jgi:hypothetical protein
MHDGPRVGEKVARDVLLQEENVLLYICSYQYRHTQLEMGFSEIIYWKLALRRITKAFLARSEMETV